MRQFKPIFSSLLISALLYVPVSAARSQTEGSTDKQAKTSTSSAPAELTASDGLAGNALGTAVAISGSTIVVGENCGESGGNPPCNSQQSAVYVYEKPKDGWGNMTQTAELTASDGAVGDGFGTSVAISGSTIVVGAVSGFNGKVYVFVKPSSGWKNMTETAQLNDGTSGDGFGGVVAIHNNTIVAGAATAMIGGNQYQGAAYVFVKPPSGWATTSSFNAQLTATDGTFQDGFGSSVAVGEQTIVVGEPYHQDRTGPGEAYVFVEPTSGWASTTQTAILTRSNPGLYDEFGSSVAISGNTIVVGAPQAVGVNNGQGVIDIFVRPSQGWIDTTERAELVSPAFEDLFGFSVGIEGADVVAGTFSVSRKIYVYARPATGGWKSTAQPEMKFTSGRTASSFGFSVGIADGAVVAGAPLQPVRGHEDQGAAFVFSE
jgi:hypothetical protein